MSFGVCLSMCECMMEERKYHLMVQAGGGDRGN